jgi:hypothetical protein
VHVYPFAPVGLFTPTGSLAPIGLLLQNSALLRQIGLVPNRARAGLAQGKCSAYTAKAGKRR